MNRFSIQVFIYIIAISATATDVADIDAKCKITLSIPDRINFGSRIFTNIKFENKSEKPLAYVVTYRSLNFEIAHRNQDGTFTPAPQSQANFGQQLFRDPFPEKLKPKTSVDISKEVGNLFDLSLPGTYKIRASLTLLDQSVVTSNAVEFTVSSSFPSVEFKRSRSNLASQISKGPVTDRIKNALELSVSEVVKNIRYGNPAKVVVTLSNVSDSAVTLPQGISLDDFDFVISTLEDEIKDERPILGQLEKTELFKNYKPIRDYKGVKLESHEALSFTVPLNYLFDMSEALPYYIKIRASLRFDEGKFEKLVSDRWTILRICPDDACVIRENLKDAEDRILKE